MNPDWSVLAAGAFVGLVAHRWTNLGRPLYRAYSSIEAAVSAHPVLGGIASFSTVVLLWMPLHVGLGGMPPMLSWSALFVIGTGAIYGVLVASVQFSTSPLLLSGLSTAGMLVSFGVYFAWLSNAGWDASMTDAATQQLIIGSGAFVWFDVAISFASVAVFVTAAVALNAAEAAYQRLNPREVTQ